MRIALVAGEASGDLLGAGLIRAIRARIPDAKFEGVAGPAMIAAGCSRIEDAEALAVMGLIEPLAEIPRLLKLRRSLIRRWKASPPDVFVGIDAPDFNFGLEKALRKSFYLGVARRAYQNRERSDRSSSLYFAIREKVIRRTWHRCGVRRTSQSGQSCYRY